MLLSHRMTCSHPMTAKPVQPEKQRMPAASHLYRKTQHNEHSTLVAPFRAIRFSISSQPARLEIILIIIWCRVAQKKGAMDEAHSLPNKKTDLWNNSQLPSALANEKWIRIWTLAISYLAWSQVLYFCFYPLTKVNGKEYSTILFSALPYPLPSALADGLFEMPHPVC